MTGGGGQLFRIDGGDGDRSFFAEPKIMRLTEAEWFPGQLRWGEAMLFVIEGGHQAGRYVAVTPRVLAPLKDQLAARGWASVIVHHIDNPTASFDGSEKDAFPIGMSVLDKV